MKDFMRMSLSLLRAGAVVAGAALSAGADAQQVIHIVVPFSAGSSTDVLARQLSDGLHKLNHNNYVIDNRPGASGIIGSTEVSRAKPDGTTLLMTTGGHVTNAVLYQKLPYDPIHGFTPISELTSTAGFLLLVPPNSPYKTLEQLLAAARAKPGTLSYGSAGIGNTTHLVGALFARAADVKLIHVPYKTSPMNDLMGGYIDMLFWGSGFATPIVKQGKARALALAGDQRVQELPDVPTLNEKGIRGVEVPAWAGLFGPPGMAPEMSAQIQRDVAAVMQRPEFAQALVLNSPGTSVVVSTPARFTATIDAERVQLKRDVGPLGITMD